MARRRLGFHDDSFAFSTLGPELWHFWPVINSYGLENIWRTQPIGGEIRPELWDCLWDEPSCSPPGQEFIRCVETTHASWLMDSGTFKGITGPARERALAGARRLGYELFVNSVELPAQAVSEGRLRASLTITNCGVAPFYHRWPVRFSLRAGEGMLRIWTNSWDLAAVVPGQAPQRFELDVALDGVPVGRHTALLSAPNPMRGGRPLRFANQTQDTTMAGWLTLGMVEVRSAPRFGPPVLSQGRLEVEISGLRVGTETEVQTSESLLPAAWQTVDAFSAVAEGMVWRQPLLSARRTAYFRVRQAN
jgi:hypothetical protein